MIKPEQMPTANTDQPVEQPVGWLEFVLPDEKTVEQFALLLLRLLSGKVEV